MLNIILQFTMLYFFLEKTETGLDLQSETKGRTPPQSHPGEAVTYPVIGTQGNVQIREVLLVRTKSKFWMRSDLHAPDLVPGVLQGQKGQQGQRDLIGQPGREAEVQGLTKKETRRIDFKRMCTGLVDCFELLVEYNLF